MKTQIFAAFSKVAAQDDGTIIVHGIASSESVDADGEIIKASAIEAALPDFMRYGTGALREMHQLVAAGTVKAEVIDGITHVEAHVVDPVAVKKVQTGVYKGFSVGGKVTSRDAALKKTITGVKLIEISLVDRPNNPDAVLTCYKVDGEDAEEPIAKGMWQVSRLASILDDLRYLQQDSAWEATYEGDSSPVPAELKTAVTALAAVLVTMVTEEVAEAVASMEPAGTVVEIVELAEPAAAITKADDPAAVTMDLGKVEDMIKAAVAPLVEQNTLLKAEVDRLSAMPAAPKAVLQVVPKTEPVEKADRVDPVVVSGQVHDVATLIKGVHAAGPIRAS